MYGQAGVSGEFGARFGVHMRLLERTDGRGETWPVVCGLHGMYGTRIQVSVPPRQGRARQGRAERAGDLGDIKSKLKN